MDLLIGVRIPAPEHDEAHLPAEMGLFRWPTLWSQSVTAPTLALDTSLAYLANTPVG